MRLAGGVTASRGSTSRLKKALQVSTHVMLCRFCLNSLKVQYHISKSEDDGQ
jgi:preprotein translocase subunit SecG